MSAPALRPCEPWVDDQEIEDIEGVNPTTRALIIGAASEVMWALSGRRFGQCSVKVRPCRVESFELCNRPFGIWPWAGGLGSFLGYPSIPMRVDGVWTNYWCRDDTSCRPTAEFRLPRKPVVSVTEVKVDGVALDSDAYRVDGYRWLVRTDGETWLLDQDLNLDDDQVGTWSVSFKYGRPIPNAGKLAARELAREMLKAAGNVNGCKLPQRTTTVTYENATVQMVDPMTFLNEGRTGLYLCDLFLATYNPNKLQTKARIYRADARSERSRRIRT